jgi:hypothetical protein
VRGFLRTRNDARKSKIGTANGATSRTVGVDGH